MKNILFKTTALSMICSALLQASGYKIPETSTNAVALSAANIAHSHGADAAYYNPANMIFMQDSNEIEVDMMYIGLDDVKYKNSSVDINAKQENFLVPSLHYVSPKLGNARVGLSIVTPGGLSKRWDDAPAIYSAKEFTLKVIEINPTMALSINDKVSIAAGFRIVQSEGVVKSSYIASRDMEGTSVDYGYNLALSYKPNKQVDIGLTYRSKVDLSETGNAKLDVSGTRVYNGGSDVTIPLPAAVSLAFAYNFQTKTTVEFVYEKTMWSSYKNLDFNYVDNIPVVLKSSFDDPIVKNWKDTDAYRIGITQNLDDLTLMAGAVYDHTPISDEKLSFELPDSDSLSVSFGARYKINDKIDAGLSTLYSIKETRDVTNDGLSGEFSNSNVTLVSLGFGYKF